MTEVVLCPECKQKFSPKVARECEVGCEYCGTHPGWICPHCEEYVDSIFNRSVEE